MKKLILIPIIILLLSVNALAAGPAFLNMVGSRSCDLPYTTNLALWLDGECSIITESGLEISQWNDISGNNNHATQSTASLKPDLAQLGGFNAVHWDGGDGMTLTSTIAFGNHTLIAVVQPDDTATVKTIITGASDSLQWSIIADEKQKLTRMNQDDISTADSATSTIAISIIAAKYEDGTGNAYKFWLNGVADGASTHNDDLSTNITEIGTKGGSEVFAGNILALVVFTEYVSDANVDAIIAYFNGRYGAY